MKNIIAYSMEKLYKDLEEADELFLSSGMKDMELYEKQLAAKETEILKLKAKKGCSRAHGSPLQRHGSYTV